MNERLAVYTAVYPAARRFLRSWFQSVEAQIDHDFDLWISLDGLEREDAINAFGGEPAAHWLTPPAGAGIAEVRQQALALLVERYDSLIFVDCDDELLPTRVQAARHQLHDYAAVACALEIIDENGRDLGVTFGLPAEAVARSEQTAGRTQSVTHYSSASAALKQIMPRYNVFGLSNTAYRAELLRRCLPVYGQTVLVDWLLATRAWALDARMFFDHTPRMRYRQYSTNVARVLPPFSGPQVLAATVRVLEHYRRVLANDWPLPATQRAALMEAQERAEQFQQAITESPAILDRYIAALNQLPPEYIWWWCVAHPQLEELWKV